jgi:pimeloyl-ACP methyl ester carboxylesterase
MLVSAAGIAAAVLAVGCVFAQVREQQKKMDAICRIRGTVTTEHPSENPLVVVLVRMEDGEATLFDHFVLRRAGRWQFFATAGTYGLEAFEDVSRNQRYEPGESFRSAVGAPTYDLAPGERLEGIEIVIPTGGRLAVEEPVDIAVLQARTHRDQMQYSLGLLTVAGEIVDLGDPRFEREMASIGLWRPWDFLFDVGPGIYFLEPYDPDKVPVLFVHGINGSPREFAALSEKLDRERFQPWFYYYPSGATLDGISEHLSNLVVNLQVRHDFDRLAVVAHSMGGLVSRSFILKHEAATGDDTVKLFVSISTPWNGHAAAEKGVRRAPVVVRSWVDVAPDSGFINGIFYEDPEQRTRPRLLPDHLSYHLLFGYRRNRLVPGVSGDTVVTVASQLRLEAQREADSVYGLDYDHTAILSSSEAAVLLNGMLLEALP